MTNTQTYESEVVSDNKKESLLFGNPTGNQLSKPSANADSRPPVLQIKLIFMILHFSIQYPQKSILGGGLCMRCTCLYVHSCVGAGTCNGPCVTSEKSLEGSP